MKQKLFLGALLLGAMSLNSCVDDKESASVTAVRDAKAEQVQAEADYNNAEAQARLIIANAEAASQKALDEYKNAEAAYYQALADAEAAKAESERQTALEEAQRHANAMKQAEYDMQVAAANLEVDLLNKQTELVKAEKAYKDALKDAEPDNAAELGKLLTTYQSALDAVLWAKYYLASDKITLDGLKAGIVSQKEAIEGTIANNNDAIAKAQTDLDEAKAELATYSKYTTLAEAQEAIEGVEKQRDLLQKDYENEKAILTKKKTVSNDAYSALQGSAYRQKITQILLHPEIKDLGNYIYIMQNWDYVNGRPSENYGKWCVAYQDENGDRQVIALFTDDEYTNELIEYSYSEGASVQTSEYRQYTSFYDLVDGGFDDLIKAMETAIAANQGKTLTAAQTEHKKAADAVTAAETKLAEAKKALADAAEADKPAKQNDVEAAQADLDIKKAALDQALTNKNIAEDALASANERVDNMKADYKVLSDNAATNAANMKAYNEASKAVAEAKVVADKAENAYKQKNSEYTALSNIISDYDYIPGSIAKLEGTIEDCENTIKRLNEENADLQKQLADLENNPDPDTAANIEWYEASIAEQEAAVEVLQKKADIAKAALDAAMAEDAPAE